MTSITLVTESKLYVKDNLLLYNYFDDYSKLFGFLVRRCVHHLRHQLNGESESRYRTNLMLEFNITNRMAKAVIKTAKNQLKLLKESARYQYNNLYKRRRSLFKKITKLKALLSSSSTSSLLDSDEAKQGKPTSFKRIEDTFNFWYKASVKE